MRPLALALAALLALAGAATAAPLEVETPAGPLDPALVTIECVVTMPVTGWCIVWCVNVANLICIPI